MLLLVDYSSMLYRAYHSMPSSVKWNGVYGCISMLTKVIDDRKPRGVAICTDDDWRPAFRVDAIPSYKAHRVSDEPDPVTPHEQLGREILEAIGLAVVGVAGYEAEDIIATLAERRMASGDREPIEILSGDRDLFALVRDPQVKVLYPTKGVSQLAEIDEAEIERRYDIPGRAYGDFALLRGDPSDGLPGVAGVGEKSAARLIRQHGSVRALLDDPSISPRVTAARDYLEAAARVVLPVRDVPLERMPHLELPTEIANPQKLHDLLIDTGLEGPVGRLLAVLQLSPLAAR
jgi:5'-3' exonuclease